MNPSAVRNLSPSRREAIDAVFCGGLVILALSGLRGAFGGYSYLVTGVLATALGLVTAHAICKLGDDALAHAVQPLFICIVKCHVNLLLVG